MTVANTEDADLLVEQIKSLKGENDRLAKHVTTCEDATVAILALPAMPHPFVGGHVLESTLVVEPHQMLGVCFAVFAK